MSIKEQRALEAYPIKKEWVGDQYGSYGDVNAESREKFLEGYEQAEKDLGLHPSTEHPLVDEEVIVLLGRYEDFPQIAFGHIVDQNIAIDYNGWNIPGVKYWMPMPKLPKEEQK